MSKERARRRAQERAAKRAPKVRSITDTDGGAAAPATGASRRAARKPARTTRQERQRRRLWAVFACWLVANALIWVFTDTWNARWLGLTLTTILVPLIVWFIWDPERRVHL